jgi:hypothetical protein
MYCDPDLVFVKIATQGNKPKTLNGTILSYPLQLLDIKKLSSKIDHITAMPLMLTDILRDDNTATLLFDIEGGLIINKLIKL